MKHYFLCVFILFSCGVMAQGFEPSSVQPSPYDGGILKAVIPYTDPFTGQTTYIYQHDTLASGVTSVDSIYLQNDTIFLRDGAGFVHLKQVTDIDVNGIGGKTIYWDGGSYYFAPPGPTPTIDISQVGFAFGENITGQYEWSAPGGADSLYVDTDCNNENGIIRVSNDSLYYKACAGCSDAFIKKIDVSSTNEKISSNTYTKATKRHRIVENGINYDTYIWGLQDSLVSGTNIKTVNGNSLLGSGNIVTPDTDTDLQKIDTFSIVSNKLRLSIQRDAERYKEVDLAPYINTDSQTISKDSTGAADNKVIGFSVSNGGRVAVRISDTQDISKDSSGTADNKVIGFNVVNGGRIAVRVSDTQDITKDSTGSAGSKVIGFSVVNGGRVTIRETDNQDLTLSTNVLSLTNDATTVSLTPYLDNVTTNLTISGTSSPVTINSSDGSDVTVSQGTGISVTAASNNITVTNTAPDQTVTIAGATGTYPNFTLPTDQDTQDLSKDSTGTTASKVIGINLVNGGRVAFMESDNQDLTILGATLSLTNDATSVTLPDASATNELISKIEWRVKTGADSLQVVENGTYYRTIVPDFLTSYTETDPNAIKTVTDGTYIDHTLTGSAISSTIIAQSVDSTRLSPNSVKGSELEDIVAPGTGFNLFSMDANGRVTSASTAAYLTANQTVTLSGDVTGSGTTAITTTIGSDKVVSGMILNGTIDSLDIATERIGTTRILNESIESIDIKNGTVDSLDIRPSAIGTTRLLDGSIENVDLQNNTIDSTKIKLSTIGTTAILDNSIEAADLQATGVAAATYNNVGVNTKGQVISGSNVAYLTTETGDISGVTATAPLTGGGTTGAVTIGIQQSTSGQSGYLSSTDWNTFNGKVGGSGTATRIPFWSGSSTLSSDAGLSWENTAKYLSVNGANSPGSTFVVSGWLPTNNGVSAIDVAGVSTNGSSVNGLNLNITTSGSLQSLFRNANGESKLRVESVNQDAYLNLNSGADYVVGVDRSNSSLNFQINASTPSTITAGTAVGLFLKNTGSFGFNTSSPAYAFDIYGHANPSINLNHTWGVGNYGEIRFGSIATSYIRSRVVGDGTNGIDLFASSGLGLSLLGTNRVRISSLDTDLSAPTTSGTTKMVVTDSNGDLSFATIPSAGQTWYDGTTYVSNWGGSGYDFGSGKDVGIGMLSAPTRDLDVNGHTRLRGRIHDSANSSGTAGQALLSDGATNNWYWGTPALSSSAATTLGIDDPTPNPTTTHAEIKLYNNAASAIGAGVTMTGGGGLTVSQSSTSNSNGGTITVTLPNNAVTSAKIAANTIVAADIANTGVSAATYNYITTNAQGQVTGGSNTSAYGHMRSPNAVTLPSSAAKLTGVSTSTSVGNSDMSIASDRITCNFTGSILITLSGEFKSSAGAALADITAYKTGVPTSARVFTSAVPSGSNSTWATRLDNIVLDVSSGDYVEIYGSSTSGAATINNVAITIQRVK